MTPEEKVSWQRWHDYGRHRYQLRAAGRAVLFLLLLAVLNVVLDVVLAFFDVVHHVSANPVASVLAATIWGLSVYFFAGHHWTARDEEYCGPTGRDSQA